MAAEQGNIYATRKLGHLYRDGNYVEKSRKNANVLYVRAAKAGDGLSLYEIGKSYLYGKEVKRNEAEAKRLLILADQKGVDDAKKLLAKISLSVKDKKKGPSGIVVGEPDKSPLPKFLKKDYKRAVAGKTAKKRHTFVNKLAKKIFGVLWRLTFALGAGFLFWWWLEGFTKVALCNMLEQIKSISTGVPTNLTLSLIVSVVVAIVIFGWTFIRGQRVKVILGALWRLLSALFVGFLFWWLLEDFDMASLSGMLEQVKGMSGGISERLTLAMMVSGGTFVGLYMLKLLPWDEWIRIIPLVIGGVLASVLIVSGSWIAGVVIALTLLLYYFSAKEDDDLYWLKSIFLVIGLCLSAGAGALGHWIVSIIISCLSLKWIDGI